MRKSVRRRLVSMAVAAGWALSLAAAASGQIGVAQQDDGEATQVRPPAIDVPERSQSWLVYLVGAALTAAAVGVAIMPSQRTHQD